MRSNPSGMKIGANYYETLSMLKDSLGEILFGGFYEEFEIVHSGGIGTCYYDKCPDKNERCDTILELNRGKTTFRYAIHGRCIDKLLRDQRIPPLN